MNLKEIECEDVDSIFLAHDSEMWRAFVNAVMKFRFDETWGICSIAEEFLASQYKLCSMNALVFFFVEKGPAADATDAPQP
jgi:hypothetical protein